MVQQIRKKAEEKGIDIAKVERAAGIGRSTIHRWDRVSPSIDKVIRVARVLGCTVDELIADADEAEGTLVTA